LQTGERAPPVRHSSTTPSIDFWNPETTARADCDNWPVFNEIPAKYLHHLTKLVPKNLLAGQL
jgi:hypothetical protein